MKRSFEYNIDEIYKDAFTNADAPLNKDEVWKGVSASLDPDRYKPVLFWLSLVTGSLLLAYFVLSLAWQSTSTQEIAASTIKPVHVGTEQAVSQNNNATTSNSNTSPPQPDGQFLPPIELNSHKAEVKPTPPVEKSHTNATSSASDVPLQSEKFTQRKESSQTEVQRTVNEELIPLGNHRLSYINHSTEIQSLSTAPIQWDKEEVEVEERRLPDPRWSRCNLKDQPRYFSDFYVFGGYPMIENKLNPDPGNDYQGFLDQWNREESAVFSYAFGMMVGIGAHWGGSVSTGLEYQQIQNKINRTQTVVERITVFDNMAYYYLDSNNNRVWVADSVTSTRIYTRETQTAKTHTLVNMPILLGYHFENEYWRVGVSAGVNVHIFHDFSGKVLDPSGQLIDADTGSNTSVYDKNMGVTLIGGLDFGYFITPHTEIYLSPRFRYNPKSWLNSSHPLESRIQLAGLRTGARWHF